MSSSFRLSVPSSVFSVVCFNDRSLAVSVSEQM